MQNGNSPSNRGAKLSPAERERLYELTERRGAGRIVGDLGVHPQTIARALAGLPCNRSTIELLRIKLGNDDKEKGA